MTCWSRPCDALARKLESPEYAAVTACAPPPNVATVSIATPLSTRAVLPKLSMPSENVTVPVGAAPAPATDTVNKIESPNMAGFRLETRVVVVTAGATTCITEPAAAA